MAQVFMFPSLQMSSTIKYPLIHSSILTELLQCARHCGHHSGLRGIKISAVLEHVYMSWGEGGTGHEQVNKIIWESDR